MVLSSVMIAVPRSRLTRLSSFVGTLLTVVLAVQLTLAGSGLLCLTQYRDGMPSMQMAHSGSRVVAGLAQQPVDEKAPPSEPCDGQGQPTQCVTMAACAPSVLPVARVVTLTPPRVPVVVASGPTIVPLSQTTAPELPPPRA